MMLHFELHVFQFFLKKKIFPRFYFFKLAGNHQNSYDGRLKLCKVLRGFQVRTITINRALQYLKAGVDAQ